MASIIYILTLIKYINGKHYIYFNPNKIYKWQALYIFYTQLGTRT